MPRTFVLRGVGGFSVDEHGAGLAARGFCGLLLALICTPAGVSGAFLLLPVQTQLFSAPSPTVTATNLLFNVITAPAGVLTYVRRRLLDIPLARAVCAGTLPGVVAGVMLRSTWLAGEERFAFVAGAMLIALGLHVLVTTGSEEGQDLSNSSAPSGQLEPSQRAGFTCRIRLVGVAAGLVGGVYGLGGAALIVPWLVSVEHVSVARAAGAGLAGTLATSIVGSAAFVLADVAGIGDATAPQWANGMAFGVGGAVGATLGAHLQSRLPVQALRAVLALAAIGAGTLLLTG